MADIRFVDTTLRDGQQSLWALNMSTAAMLPALDLLDAACFDGIEFWVPSTQVRKMIKDLREDPWPWLVDGARRARRTPLRYHGSIDCGLGDVPVAIGRLLVEKAVSHGVTTARFSDPWNDFDVLAWQVDELRQMGMRSVVNLIYSVSPRHTVEYYVERTKAAAALDPYRICVKDVGGLLTPDVARELIPKIVSAAGSVPLEFHGHCNNGLAGLNYLEVAAAGITVLHTAVPPLASGTSNPSVFSVAKNLEAAGHTVELDVEPLRRVSRHFEAVAARAGLPKGEPQEYDVSQYAHQVPGGMVSNLRYQLARLGREEDLAATLEEAARVRAEFGYPIMVTPLSQFVGSQAALNVITGRRYESVTDEVIWYALGRFGAQAVTLMDKEVREKILGRPRAEHLVKQREVPTPSIEDLRRKFGSSISDEELVVRVCGGFAVDEPVHLRTPGPARLAGRHPITELLEGIIEGSTHDHVTVSGGRFRIEVVRSGREVQQCARP